MIESNMISVIIQGPIINDNQGGTREVCNSIRHYLPEAEIIISTWEGQNLDDCTYDKLIINTPIKANKVYRPGEFVPKLNTVNHQIITTLEGLKKANRKYTLKLRSDLMLVGVGFLNYFEKYRDVPSDTEYLAWKVFKQRLVTLPTFNVRSKNVFPYNICDWTFFGLTEDVYNYFDIPLIDTYNLKTRDKGDYPYVVDNFGAEQFYCISWLRKHREVDINNAVDSRDKTKKEFEIALANNFIPIDASEFGVYSFKYGRTGYAMPVENSHGFYSLSDWERIYNLYGGGCIKIPFRFKDAIYYPVHYRLYLLKETLIKNRFIHSIYKKVRGIRD